MAKIDQLLKFMVKAGASDLHLSSNCLPKLRIDGDMRSVSGDKSDELTSSQVHALLEEIVPDRNKDEFEKAGSHQHSRMPYYSIPESVLENKEDLIFWAKKSMSINSSKG